MSFALNVKNELSSLETANECCKHAEAYGMFIMGRSFGISNINLQTENELVASKYALAIKDTIGVEPLAQTSFAGKTTVSIKKKEQCLQLLNTFGHTGKELSLHINRSNFSDECCHAAFLRGAFLSCGAVTDPNKNYHLEFSMPFNNLCKDLNALLCEMGFSPKEILRKGSHIIYFKDSESIEDILTVMGATNSTIKIMEVKVMKDIRNRVNRTTNCETANLTKTVNASLKQIKQIEYIEKIKGKGFIPPELSIIAKLRVENPEISLSELGNMLTPALSRSGVNHRLKKIQEIYESIVREGRKK